MSTWATYCSTAKLTPSSDRRRHRIRQRRRSLGIIRASGDADIARIGADAVGNIKANPAQIIDMRLCPGMACFLFDPVGQHQIATDIARRNAEHARSGNKDMRMVLTHAMTRRQRHFGGGFGIGAPVSYAIAARILADNACKRASALLASPSERFGQAPAISRLASGQRWSDAENTTAAHARHADR